MPEPGGPDDSATYGAIDLGAESGRVMLARLHGGILTTTEIRRFANEPVRYGESLHWDTPRLWLEICRAIEAVEQDQLQGIGVDAWGVDYALLGESGELLQNPYHYRDARTRGMMESALERIPKEEIYSVTGIQFMPINTLYQLLAAKRDTPELLRLARRLVTIPDLFHYWLTGVAACEYTNATTTQMVSPSARKWATELMDRFGLPSNLPADLAEPGTTIGPIRPEVTHGRCSAPVILPGSHDTASAVAAVSARDHTAFLSSGTWSLLGIEVDAPVITPDALRLNFTNEGGVNGTTRLLKNVMGLWLVQSCRQTWVSRGLEHSYQELMTLAVREAAFQFLINPDDESFLNPVDMTRAIDMFCDRTGQPRPSAPAAYVRGILESLAFKYRLVIESLEQVIGKRIERLRIIGGGSKNRLLNQFTADATSRTVLAGPAEATALGNVAIQMLATGAASSLKEARAIIERSFLTEVYEPLDPGRWDDQANRFRHYCELAKCLK
jgi:rhamnulokinase